MSNHVTNWNNVNQKTKTVNESLTTEIERYKERVKTLEQRFNVDLNSCKKLIDSQIDDMIRNREKESKYMDKEIDLENKIKELYNIVYKVVQSAQTVHMLTKPQVFYDDNHKQDLGYQNSFYLKKAWRIKPTLYDGSIISRKHDVIYVVDEEKALVLEEESRLKMLAKQNDPILIKLKISITPTNYKELNKLAEDFGKCFVPKKESYAEQALWLPLSNPISEQLVQTTPIKMEAPSELPKVSMVKTSFQKLKNHLAIFNKVVKVRTTPDAITDGSWGFEHTKAVFKQECSMNKKYFDIQKKENFLDNDRLLEHIICQDVMNIVMHVDSVSINMLPANNKFHISVNSLTTLTNYAKMKQDYIDEYNENLVLRPELAKKEHVIEKKFFDEVVLRYAPKIQEFFNITEWQAKLNAKDVFIANLRIHIESLKGKNVIKKDATPNKAKIIAPGMFKLDLEPLSPKVLKNKDAHIDYIKYTQENADILQELVEHARALRPLDSDLDFVYKYAKRIHEVLVYVTATCPSLAKPSEKLVAVTPLNKNKNIRNEEFY
ncbi:hypothetical protein Tco_1406677 [Tanacetum coccineum]